MAAAIVARIGLDRKDPGVRQKNPDAAHGIDRRRIGISQAIG
jgi:hypothetical protein